VQRNKDISKIVFATFTPDDCKRWLTKTDGAQNPGHGDQLAHRAAATDDEHQRSNSRHAAAASADRIGKVFVAPRQDMRECLICDAVFTKQGVPNMPIWSTANIRSETFGNLQMMPLIG
jgi:hypothetical protein